MKINWKWVKGIIPWILIGFFWISATFIIFKLTEIKISDKIQAWAVVTLAVITGIYAYQTFKLVQQEKIALDEEKKRRTVDFWQSRLTEFFIPLKINLQKLQKVVKLEPFSSDEFSKTISAFIELMSKAYMLSPELNNSLISFLNMFKFQKREKVEEGEKYAIIEQSEELLKKVNIEIRIFEYKINEIYGFKIDKKLKDFIDKLRIEIL